MVRVSEIMTRSVTTIEAESTVADAARLLSSRRFTGLPVVNADGLLVGIVSEMDILMKSGRRVADIMSTDVVSITESHGVEEVARLMNQLHIRRLPVLQSGRLVGIVTRADLLHFFATHVWVCFNCGSPARGLEAPTQCDVCGATGRDRFHLDPAPPGM